MVAPPPSSAPCTGSSDCTHECGVTPADYQSVLGLPTAQPGQCYQCHTQSWTNAPGWCQFVQANSWSADKCCVLHTCNGNCATEAPAPPSPPEQCQAPSGCNYGCGHTPSEYSAARIPQLAPNQCFFCDTWYTSDAPAWCTYRHDGWVDYCCVVHECTGDCLKSPPPPPPQTAGGGTSQLVPPPPPDACVAEPSCNYACGETPNDFRGIGIPTARPDQCFFCSTYSDNAPGWCEYRQDNTWSSDRCCVLHSCSGGCASPPTSTEACDRPSGCNSDCGKNPRPQFLTINNLPLPQTHECFYCVSYNVFNAPNWCTYREDNTWSADR